MLLSVQALEKRYGSEVVLQNISFTLDIGHRVALVGKNGVGKSTIMKILAGTEEPTSGRVTLTNGRTVSYLPQEVKQDDERTGVEYIQNGTDLQPHQFFPILEGLGVSQETAAQKLTTMSGGQQTKILLTRFLLEPSDIMLLDEPTNNLDIPSLLWLEIFLASSKKSMIIISHDLAFLNTVANRVFEIRGGKLFTERGSYGDYIERKKKEYKRQLKDHYAYRNEIQRLESIRSDLQKKGTIIDTKKSSDNNKLEAGAKRDAASAGQSRVNTIKRRIKRMPVVEKPYEDEPFTLAIHAQKDAGDIEIIAKKMVAGYPNGVTIGPASFTLKPGDRMCLMGMNGTGKSTVLKTVVGNLLPLQGEVTASEAVSFGDLLQQHERADRNERSIDFFIEQTSTDVEKATHMLKRAGFSEQMLAQKVSGLSSGMRARLLFSIFVVLGVNVLVLDEPTNHLDMEAVVALKDLLQKYTGAVLLVSHNRWFLEDLSISVYYEIVDGEMSRIVDFDEYVVEARKRAERMVTRLKRVVSI